MHCWREWRHFASVVAKLFYIVKFIVFDASSILITSKRPSPPPSRLLQFDICYGVEAALLYFILLLTYFEDGIFCRPTPPMFFSLKNGRTIDSNYPKTWPASTDSCPSSGSASFGDQIAFSKTPRKSLSKLWQYPIITFGSTKIAPFSTWSSESRKKVLMVMAEN